MSTGDHEKLAATFHGGVGPPAEDVGMGDATVAAVLDFEARWSRHTGAKDEAIRTELGITPPRFYVLLKRAAESLEGQAHDAVTAHRVLRKARKQEAAKTKCHQVSDFVLR